MKPSCAWQPQPDLILLDVMMPGVNGYAVLVQLQGNPDTKVGIPGHILLKPGKQMPQEMEVMKTHAILIRTSPMLFLPTLATLSPLPNAMMMAAEC